ncbi:hypothetical protein GEV33_006038 [Tenebrio molitor]|uniref:Uncharacterized protein n=1 Tax=Tenebrio molitor TaxID=7067 RepID=A0A8J6HNE6_TENMO|nr:hypothetical protein GEV33_006038 [Tenebrio molitor]
MLALFMGVFIWIKEWRGESYINKNDAVHLGSGSGPVDLCPRFNWEPPLFPRGTCMQRKNTTTNHSDGSSTLLLIRHATHGKFGVRVCVKLDNGPTHPYIMPRMFIKMDGRGRTTESHQGNNGIPTTTTPPINDWQPLRKLPPELAVYMGDSKVCGPDSE